MEIRDVEVIREQFSASDAKRDLGLRTPDNIQRYDNIAYDVHGDLNTLDVYHQKDVHTAMPTIVNIHGGGWIYGSKEVYQFYCMDLAQRGFTVVNFSYRLAPEDPWPAALVDINSVFTWICEHAKEYCIDLNNVFIVGDSAGAQLTSQYVTLLTNKEFQRFYEFEMPTGDIHIRAVGLNCGFYDVKKYIQEGKEGCVYTYLGDRLEEAIPAMDTIKYITKDFPPAFIMTAHCDFLKDHAEPMYKTLTKLGIPCEYKVYGSPDRDDIAHVFHVNIKLEEAKECNDDECNFFKQFIG